MDCVSAASDLKKLLVAHSHAENQVSVLECGCQEEYGWNPEGRYYAKISKVSRQTLESALEGDRSKDLHLSLRLSVCEGVRLMYHSYQNKKWAQVQVTARSIIDNLEGDRDTEQTTAAVTSPMTSPVTSPSGGSTRTDKAADKWSTAFCEFYRDE